MQTHVVTILIFVKDTTAYNTIIATLSEYLNIGDPPTSIDFSGAIPAKYFYDYFTADSAELKGSYYIFDPTRKNEKSYQVVPNMLHKTKRPTDHMLNVCIDAPSTSCDALFSANNLIAQLHELIIEEIK